jgi:hypothetical protein
VNVLLKKGVNPNAYSDISLLSIAIGKDEPAIVETLLRAGAKVDVLDAVVEPPLKSCQKSCKAVEWLSRMATHVSVRFLGLPA